MARITDSGLFIRPFRGEDRAFVHDLAERAFSAFSIDPKTTIRGILGERGAETLIAEVGELRLGFVVVAFEQLARDFGPWQKPLLARVNAIAVRPDAQQRGVGRTLLAEAEELCRAREVRCISLSTAEGNTRARKLFTSAGFFPLFKVDRFYARGQRAVAMLKPLVETA